MVFSILADAGVAMSKQQVEQTLDKIIELFPDFISLLNSEDPSSEDLLKLSVMPQAMNTIVEGELQKLQTEAERLVEVAYGVGEDEYVYSKSLLNRAGELKSSYHKEMDKLQQHLAQQAGA